jgi:hypothetical protein
LSNSEKRRFVVIKSGTKFYRALGLGFTLLLFFGVKAFALTDIIEGADVQASSQSVKAIMASFGQAEEALRSENLAKMMEFYTDDYRNRGLRKEGTSWIWEDIFARYDELSSRHVFSKIIVDAEKGIAQVTCTGALFGSSVFDKERKPTPASVTSEPIMIDSWFEAIHYLILEKEVWKIIGHDPAIGEQDTFGAGIHLLF